jgi:ribonuclease VapC
VVVDTSALLSLIFREPSGPWVAEQLQSNRRDLSMSSVNYAEALILIQSKQPFLAASIREAIELTSIRIVAPSQAQAELAADARHRYPLNLGDCFAYALAKDEDCPLLTLDRDFRNTDVRVILPRT